MSRPVILISNDDGIHAEGLHALESALAPLGRVYTVAPETEQSAMSHAMTLSRPLRLRRLAANRFAVDGTPVDCVYVALHYPGILPSRPAVVVSGINHGLNLGTDVFYSGTVAAAREGALRGVPALAVSLPRSGDRELAGRLARDIVSEMLSARAKKNASTVLLNLNVPTGRVKGLRATRLGPRLYDEIVEMRTDPRGQQYLWIGGPNVVHPPSEGTDTAAYEAGYASLTPLTIELFRDDQLAVAKQIAAGVRPSAAPTPATAGESQQNSATRSTPARTRGGRRAP